MHKGKRQDHTGVVGDLISDVKGTTEVLFSTDLEALYPSITAATEFYARNTHEVSEELKRDQLIPLQKPPTPAVFKECLEMVITENVFHYQERQLKGTAMEHLYAEEDGTSH